MTAKVITLTLAIAAIVFLALAQPTSAQTSCDAKNPDSCAGSSSICQHDPKSSDPSAGLCVERTEVTTNRDTGGLVPCTTNCNYCDLLNMVQRIVIGKDGKSGLLGTLVPAIGIFLIVIAGLMMLTSAGNEQRIKSANSMIVNVISGLALIYTAWLIVHGTLTLLVAKESSVYNIVFPWYKIECNLSGGTSAAATPTPPPAP